MYIVKLSDGTCIFAKELQTSTRRKTLELNRVEFQDIHTKQNIKSDRCLVYKAYVVL